MLLYVYKPKDIHVDSRVNTYYSQLGICISSTCQQLFVTPKSIPASLSQSFVDMHIVMTILSHPTLSFPTDSQQGDSWLSWYSPLTASKCPFAIYLGHFFFVFLCIFMVVLPFNMAPKNSVGVLCSVARHKKVVMCPLEKV